ncbi:MAG TPA: hypothetical protein DD670_10990 [Planctomycetaceae bacterium]|nr:hypothetical protein [Planctomycetaceae bacterium]
MSNSFQLICENFTARPTGIIAAVLMLAVLAGGCGPSGPKRVKVEGKVTFNGSPPPADGSFYFAPSKPAPGFPARPAYATFSMGDGTFVVGSVKSDDGLVPGVYRVTLECWRQQPSADGTPGRSHVPEGYIPPELEIKVDESGPIRFDFDVAAGG